MCQEKSCRLTSGLVVDGHIRKLDLGVECVFGGSLIPRQRTPIVNLGLPVSV
jgi:hypothetical protein